MAQMPRGVWRRRSDWNPVQGQSLPFHDLIG
jgi:hypothetical protein